MSTHDFHYCGTCFTMWVNQRPCPRCHPKTQPCGHPESEIESLDEGTSHCGACERESRHADD